MYFELNIADQLFELYAAWIKISVWHTAPLGTTAPAPRTCFLPGFRWTDFVPPYFSPIFLFWWSLAVGGSCNIPILITRLPWATQSTKLKMSRTSSYHIFTYCRPLSSWWSDAGLRRRRCDPNSHPYEKSSDLSISTFPSTVLFIYLHAIYVGSSSLRTRILRMQQFWLGQFWFGRFGRQTFPTPYTSAHPIPHTHSYLQSDVYASEMSAPKMSATDIFASEVADFSAVSAEVRILPTYSTNINNF